MKAVTLMALACLWAFTCAIPIYGSDAVENIWVVLIAGSNGWYNYRHQSDVAHSYHLLRNHGVPAEQIVTLMYDDIAHNPLNPYPGKIFNSPNGSDVYAGVKIDYKGEHVNSDVFLNVLKGNKTGNKGIGTGRVLESDSDDHVFVYYSDHGGFDILGMPTGFLHREDLDEALLYLSQKKAYKKLLFYIEACESGSIFRKLDSNEQIYGITAATANESSYAVYCTNPQKLPCLGDEFSVNWIHNTELNNILRETVGKQVDTVTNTTLQSHVSTFGDKTVREETVSEYQGKEDLYKPLVNVNDERSFFAELSASAIDSRNVQMLMAERRLRSMDADAETVTRYLTKWMRRREDITEFIENAAKAVGITQPRLIAGIMSKTPKEAKESQCHKTVFTAFDKQCAPLHRNPFAFTLSAPLANLCEFTRSPTPILNYFAKECFGGPRFINVL